MLDLALDHNGPITLRYPRGRGLGVGLDQSGPPMIFGRAEELRTGRDVLILAAGAAVYPALDAAEALAAQGIDAGVINARFIKPLDEALILDRAREIGRVVCVEENTIVGGFGSAVGELLMESGLDGIRIKRLGIPDTFIEHGTQAELRRDLGLDARGIHETVLDFLD